MGENMEPIKTAAIHCELVTKINFACHQSSFALLRDLRIENISVDQPMNHLNVTLTSDPGFLNPKSWSIDRILPGESVNIKDRDIQLEGAFLLSLVEAVHGEVKLSVFDGEVCLAQESIPVDLLAYNEWGGTSYMPELLAAFCVPNDPAVDRILHEASLVLRRSGKPDGIDGYGSKQRQRVWEIVSAIYVAIGNLGITYSVPPASFERNGQKIRLPGQILENRIATCLDTSLLFSAVLEQAGLNPVIVLPEGHAMVGVWLQPIVLPSIVILEAESLRKSIQLKDLLLVETTSVTSRIILPFSKALKVAQEQIVPEKDATFIAAVDVRCARSHRIVPLGMKTVGTTVHADGRVSTVGGASFEEAPPLPSFDDFLREDEIPTTPSGRLERWQRKLLDLSARNPLLNHKSLKTSLKFICPEPGLLEDKLAKGARLSIQTVAKLPFMGQDQQLHLQSTGESITEEYARDALEKNQVLVDIPEEDLARRSVEIYRTAQTALQEGGANTLYLALGFLLWKREISDEHHYRAPLILIPVTLERKSVRSGVRIMSHDDEPRFNTTLLEMLRKDFQIEVQGLDGSLPEDDSGVDVNSIWMKIRRAVKDAPGFEMVEDVVLGHFSFAKYLMWKDLRDRIKELKKSRIVKHLIESPRDPFPSTVPFVDASQLDQLYHPTDLLVPLPVDSSQMAAVATADKGKDFILIGPPGTGKSQTISNIIAHLLGKGKSVLFVSEKVAALDVVARRLKDVGLGQYCLELHSNKARKIEVLEQLRSTWESHQSVTPNEWKLEAERLEKLRNQLNLVVDRLHCKRNNGMTVHHAIGIKVRDEHLSHRVMFSWPSSGYHDVQALSRIRDAVEKLRIQVAAVGDIKNGPFGLVASGNWSPVWESQILKGMAQLSAAAAMVDAKQQSLYAQLGIPNQGRSLQQLYTTAELAAALVLCYQRQVAFALDTDASAWMNTLEEAARQLDAYIAIERQLSCPYEPMAWRQIDGNDIHRKWQAASSSWWPKRWFLCRKIIKELILGGAKGIPDPAVDGKVLAEFKTIGQAIDSMDRYFAVFKEWSRHSTRSDQMRQLKVVGERIRIAVGRISPDSRRLAENQIRIRNLIQEGNELLAPEAAVGCAIQEYLAAMRDLHERIVSYESISGVSIRGYYQTNDDFVSAIGEAAALITARHAELHDWCGWRRRRQEALDCELGPLVEAIENGTIPTDEIEMTFEAAYCAWWSGAVIGEDEVLRTFSTPEHNDAIMKFRKIDTHFQKLTAAYISASLSGRVPSAEDVKRSSTWGVLRHELQKKIRHKSIRQLVLEIPDVLSTLTPCLMMSPLSVAQYLPASQPLFDVVIFDEASQITVWDAIGSLARGKQVIVAGDPKQMPPTNFFTRSDEDPDGDMQQEADLDSILDEMLGASIPQHTLNLHYRSRRESLIAFSNSRYYDNRLITFPAPYHPDHGVRLVRTNGFYARGRHVIMSLKQRRLSPIYLPDSQTKILLFAGNLLVSSLSTRSSRH